MKKYLIPLLLGLASFCFATACKEYDELEGARIITVSASFQDDATRADIEQAQGSLNLVTRWREDDKISLFLLQDGKGYTLEPVKVYNISSDGKRCSFDIRLPADISMDRAYDIYGLCDAEGVLWEEEGFVYAKSELKRMSWNNRIVPMWFHEQGGKSNIQANFLHLGTYEILHVTNSSKAGVTFRHDGFDVDEPWYKSSENTPLKEDYDPTHNVEEPGDDASSGSVFIPAGSTEKILSWYVPRGGTIIDATLLATINGNSVRSSNTKNSSVRIQRGHVYHMYATWDGNELKFDDHGIAFGTLEIETPEIEFEDVIVKKWGYEYLVIRNDGDEEQKVKVEIEGYTYDSPFELYGADLGDSYVYKIIPSGESRGFALSFRPPSLGEFSGNLVVTSENLNGWKAFVPMHGKGVEEQVDNSFHLSENSINVYLHDNRAVDIYNGSGEYDVVNENPDIVEWDINGIHVAHAPATRSDGTTGRPSTSDLWYITGNKLGNATLRLTDKQTNEELILQVKVINSPSLELESSDVEMNVGEEKRVKILSGSEWYQVSSDDESIVASSKATIDSGGSGGLYGDDRPNTGIYVILKAMSAGQTTVRVKDMSSYEEATIQVTVVGGIATPEIVDLGLPSGLKWASFNLGATKPEEPGDYYAFGETESKEEYAWETYKWCNGAYYSLTKYCFNSNYGFNGFVDNKCILDPDDDVASIKLGGNWRMPTKAEQDELSSRCNWKWTSINGVDGWQVTGPNNNSIFLPLNGFWQESGFNSEIKGVYWSSSLDSSFSGTACAQIFWPGPYVTVSWGSYPFCDGLSVRPVYADSNSPEIEVTPTDIEFGAVPYGSSSTKYVTVKNIGTGVLTFSVTNVRAPYYVETNADGNPKEYSLSAGESMQLAFTFTPNSATYAGGGRCTIVSNATESVISVWYTGKAGEPASGASVPEAVDLGLSVQWASFNLGATRPEEYGDYYAWGETEPYYSSLEPLTWKPGKEAGYDWPSYKWCTGSDDTMTKYCTVSSYGYNGLVDGKTSLDPEDDAAYKHLGGYWRMPTQDEIDELYDILRCSWELTSLNGVKGYKVTGHYGGNSIFLPCAGRWNGDELDGVESSGEYWTSSLYEEKPRAAYYWQGYSGQGFAFNGAAIRSAGLPIRPVYDDPDYNPGYVPGDPPEGGLD